MPFETLKEIFRLDDERDEMERQHGVLMDLRAQLLVKGDRAGASEISVVIGTLMEKYFSNRLKRWELAAGAGRERSAA